MLPISHRSEPTLSFEFFPPRDPSGWGTLYSTMGEISRLAPDFVTVTYRAGGSTGARTIELVSRIQRDLDIEAVAHLTCVGHSRDEIALTLDSLNANGVRNIMALRGDPPKGSATFVPHPEGFAHGSDLIAFIQARSGFTIGCAYYPEKHPEAASLADDIAFLKVKQDCGAQFAVSQFFFDNDAFFRYRDAASKAGISIPLIAGILPITEFKQIARFEKMSGNAIPQVVKDLIGAGESALERGVEFGVAQCANLLENGVAGIHLYTLNFSVASGRITTGLRALGYFGGSATVPREQGDQIA